MKQKKLFTEGISRCLLNAATLAFLSILFTLFLLPRTGFAFVEVMSGSMEPGISAGDIVLIHTHEERIREGDVISFQKGGVQMLHRVIEKNGEGFRTKGDANREPDAFFVRREEIRERVRTLAEELGLTRLLERRTAGLSLGEIQKTALARALSFGPELLFLDEPCASIDPNATQEIERLLLKRKEETGMTILIITHDLAQAGRLADRIVLLKEGRVVEACGAKKFFTHPDEEETRRFTGGELLI